MSHTLGIVTISYNQAPYLADAIESVRLGGETANYIIVDAGSTDGSREIIARYLHRFRRVILEPDHGPADGLNKGFADCSGDILGYLNSDDRFAPGALDFVVRYFDTHPEIDVLCGAIRMIDGRGRVSRRYRTPDRVDLRQYAYGVCFFWQQATFFRRRAFEKAGGFNISNRTTWDGELVVDMALAGCTFGYVDEILGDFRIHQESITGSGRLHTAVLEDRERMRTKILEAGIPPASRWEAHAMRLSYKFNFRRHFSYWFAAHSAC